MTMKYNLYDLGTVRAGHSVEIVLDCAANVRLMTESNFDAFKVLKEHDFIGGYVKFAPYIVNIPATGHWYAVVDLGGHEGSVKASIRVYQGEKKRAEKAVKLPEIVNTP